MNQVETQDSSTNRHRELKEKEDKLDGNERKHEERKEALTFEKTGS
jgi:hypothetical protein